MRSYADTGLPGDEGVQRGRRVDNDLALTGISGQENAVAWFQAASMPESSGYPQMALTGDVKFPVLLGADDQ